MLKYFTKLALEIVPSVIATILGAYIVNHYITSRPAADAPAAAVSPADAKKVQTAKIDPKVDPKTESKPTADVTNLPEPGVKAKGISEKAILGKPAESVPEKAADKPAEPVGTATEPRRIPMTREKSVAKAAPVATAPAATAPLPVEATAPEEHRDATELARAAIERLRATSGSNETPRAQETVRTPEPPRVQEPPRSVVVAPSLKPLPPPITVVAPTTGMLGSPSAGNPPYTSSVRIDDPLRPTPPADIPTAPPPSRPLDLRADGATVADDVLSAAKSMFHAVLPK